MSTDKDNTSKESGKQENSTKNSTDTGYSPQGNTGTNPTGKEGYDAKSQTLNDHKLYNTPGGNTEDNKSEEAEGPIANKEK